jgi:heterodisulfide reductase subunit C
VDGELPLQWEAIRREMLRVRWHIVNQRARDGKLEAMVADWRRWADEPIQTTNSVIAVEGVADSDCGQALFEQLGFTVELTTCMTCTACTTSCPVSHDRELFDPVAIFRLLNFGNLDELLGMPSIWMCLSCQRCTDVCTQQVPGHLVLAAVQQLSIDRGCAPTDMRAWLWEVDQRLHAIFIQRVGSLFVDR